LIIPRISPDAISVVVPVRDNQAGVDRLLHAFSALPAEAQPRFIVIVDNASRPPIVVKQGARLLLCTTPGPAAARNVGWRACETPWILFLDSDCIPTETTLSGYAAAYDGSSIAYAGHVKALGTGLLNEYYDVQGTLLAPLSRDGSPGYLVTANALVLRNALSAIGGFRETFATAAGEDVDLSLRLKAIGPASFAPRSRVIHDFGHGLGDFVGRFVRYGRGNRQVAARHYARDIPGVIPRPFAPARLSLRHGVCALLQFAAMRWGWEQAEREPVVRRGKGNAEFLSDAAYAFDGFQITTRST
jgi:GT2 family glycosyltransferase